MKRSVRSSPRIAGKAMKSHGLANQPCTYVAHWPVAPSAVQKGAELAVISAAELASDGALTLWIERVT